MTTVEDSPMVYSVVPTPNTRTTRRAGIGAQERRRGKTVENGRPDSEDVLERAAKSYERERRNLAGGGGGGSGGAKTIEEEWQEIRLVDHEDRESKP